MTRVYVLSDEMRVANAPYSLQGTTMRYDIPHEYPLPFETEVLEDGVPVTLRFIPNSKLIRKLEQIEKEKRPEYINPSDADRKILTFMDGRLELDDQRNKNAVEFLEATGWHKKNEAIRPRGVKCLFEEFREDELLNTTIEKEELISRAKASVLALKERELRDVFLLSVPGGYDTSQISISKMKVHLLEIAAANPQFVLDGVKSGRDRATLTLTKALDIKLINLGKPGQVAIKGVKGWEMLIEASDAGGPEAKFNRTVDYLLTEAGAPTLKILESRIAEAESHALQEAGALVDG